MAHATPEDAARGDIPARFVTVVAVVERGDRVLVAQLTNDRPPHEPDTVQCTREPDGTWAADSSANSTGGLLPTGDGVGTIVAWDEAPEGVMAARFACQGRQLTVPVERGCAVAVFDDVALSDGEVPLVLPRWIRAQGTAQGARRDGPSARLRDRARRMLRGQHADPHDGR